MRLLAGCWWKRAAGAGYLLPSAGGRSRFYCFRLSLAERRVDVQWRRQRLLHLPLLTDEAAAFMIVYLCVPGMFIGISVVGCLSAERQRSYRLWRRGR